MLSEKLKKETLESHQALEKVLIQKIKSVNTLEDYSEILNWFYNFYSPIESQVDQYISENILNDYSQRRKSASLAHDIISVNGTLPENPRQTGVQIENVYDALGALYVMEGSTIGGSIISKMISDRLGLQNKEFLTYFNSYGENTMSMWKSFKESLDQFPATGEQQLRVVKSANNTFKHFKLLITQHEQQNQL
ncbi:biliverdin-producing heme oxygenase [Daejeonella oryzae]|uniref:biliverdin-producing heme oxygenase n=1 Tax=Daejeonella oryzae TaxID=1122943 RepID=UPI00042943B9|nr:biliverdin-producing heme oxygenase [Daejeonella oryzae]